MAGRRIVGVLNRGSPLPLSPSFEFGIYLEFGIWRSGEVYLLYALLRLHGWSSGILGDFGEGVG